LEEFGNHTGGYNVTVNGSRKAYEFVLGLGKKKRTSLDVNGLTREH